MTDLITGIAGYAVMMMALGFMMVRALMAHSRAPEGPLLRRLLPYIAADGVLTVLFVVWFLGQV